MKILELNTLELLNVEGVKNVISSSRKINHVNNARCIILASYKLLTVDEIMLAHETVSFMQNV